MSSEHLDVPVVGARSPRPEGADAPFLDLASGSVQRSVGGLPEQGGRTPWTLRQDHLRDVVMLRRGPVEDGGIAVQRPVAATAGTQQAVV